MTQPKLSNYSIPIWIIENEIRTEKGDLFEFKDHLFLFDILKDLKPKQVIKKCAQVGVSVSMNLKAFFLADKRDLHTIYTMPSDSDVQEFSKTKTDKIFQANEVLRQKIKIDNVELKQINNAFIYFKGTRSKAAPISTTADLIIKDEVDRSDQSILETYDSRIVASKYKGNWLISNPSFNNMGVDLYWKDSDKKEWFIKCNKCNKEQHLVWDENVDEIRGLYVCKFCNAILTDNDRRLGHWKPTGNKTYFSGYHISQMMAPWLSAQDLIKEKETKGIEYFRNFILGEPAAIGEFTDFRQLITDSWTEQSIDTKPYYMGIDVGKEKHWVLGSQEGIFRVGKCESREELEDILRRYNPTAVIDSGPERTWAEEFKKKYPKMFLCFYRRDKNIADMIQWGGEKGNYEDVKNWGYVWIDRNRVIDAVIHTMHKGEILFNLNREDLEKYIAHWETMRRIMEETSLKTNRYIWESSTGVNHWASATWFYYLARKRGHYKTKFVSDIGGKPKEVVEITSDGYRMRPLKELIEEQL